MRTLLGLILLIPVQDRPGGPFGDAYGKLPKVPKGVNVEKDLVYASPDETDVKLDLYRTPSDRARPAIVFIHGGGWRSRDKGDFPWYCAMLAKEGYVVASINYRYSSVAKYPAQIEDGQNAVRWLRKNAKKYGILPDRIGAIGGSAGGHLAGLLGSKNEEGAGVQAVVSCFGECDLQDAPGGRRLIGGTPETKHDLWKDACSSTHVSKDDPPSSLCTAIRTRRSPSLFPRLIGGI